MTGELGSAVTGSPNLNLTTGTLGSGVTGGSGLTNVPKDATKVASGAFSAVDTIDIQGCFTSDYKFYKLYLGGYSRDAYIRIGYLNESGSHLTSTYYSQYIQFVSQDGSEGFTRWDNAATQSIGAQQHANGFQPNNTWHQTGPNESSLLEMFFWNPLDTTTLNPVRWQSQWSGGSYLGWNMGSGLQDSTVAKHGLRFGGNANAFRATGHFAVYGYKV